VIKILEKLSLVPQSSGVYIMKDAKGQVIYIGKAKNLPNRLANYFKNKVHDAKTTAMIARVCDFDYFVCRTENDALGLEANLIKT
jgi:excinuclease ABC subunit C